MHSLFVLNSVTRRRGVSSVLRNVLSIIQLVGNPVGKVNTSINSRFKMQGGCSYNAEGQHVTRVTLMKQERGKNRCITVCAKCRTAVAANKIKFF